MFAWEGFSAGTVSTPALTSTSVNSTQVTSTQVDAGQVNADDVYVDDTLIAQNSVATQKLDTAIVQYIPQTARPSAPQTGAMFYSDTFKQLQTYDGQFWDFSSSNPPTIYKQTNVNQTMTSSNTELPIEQVRDGLITVLPDDPALWPGFAPVSGARGSYFLVPEGFIGRVVVKPNLVFRNNGGIAQTNANITLTLVGSDSNQATTIGTGVPNISSIDTSSQIDFAASGPGAEIYDAFNDSAMILNFGGTENLVSRSLKIAIKCTIGNILAVGPSNAVSRFATVTVYPL